MLTTQIGSLPFKDVNFAIDYACDFDLPFVPTLPMYCQSEFMAELALSGLDNNDPTPTEICLLATLKRLHGKKCKYQIMGPDSLYRYLLLQNKKISYREVETFLFKKIQKVLDLFDSYCVTPILFFDEPMLQSYENIANFVTRFDVYTGLHTCAKADWTKFSEMKIDYLSLDFLLYDESILETKDFKNLVRNKVICFGLISTNLTSCNTIIKELSYIKGYLKYSNHYITPTCGLSLSNEDYVKELTSKQVKHYLDKL